MNSYENHSKPAAAQRDQTVTESPNLFNIDPDMSATLDNLEDEELRSFAEMQNPDDDGQIELYIYTQFLVFKRAGHQGHLERAWQQAKKWVAATPKNHQQHTRRTALLGMLSARRHRGRGGTEPQNFAGMSDIEPPNPGRDGVDALPSLPSARCHSRT